MASIVAVICSGVMSFGLGIAGASLLLDNAIEALSPPIDGALDVAGIAGYARLDAGQRVVRNMIARDEFLHPRLQ
ncbi:hypothetical protein ACUSIJ_21640 [Pseudochelatococcus sp. B33]